MSPHVRNVIPFPLRDWRRAPFKQQTWRAIGAFRHALRAQYYDAILDLQEQVKGALVASSARGTHGFDRASIREPLAAWLDDVRTIASRANCTSPRVAECSQLRRSATN